MREIRPSGSEGGGAFRSPYPYQTRGYFSSTIARSQGLSLIDCEGATEV